jgi:hypothetical protein
VIACRHVPFFSLRASSTLEAFLCTLDLYLASQDAV